jgi:acylphosphatase
MEFLRPTEVIRVNLRCKFRPFCATLPIVMSAQAKATSVSPHRRTCYFSGRVQGVGFRYTVHNLAMPHDVRGYVRNLPDGRVELVMEGPDQEMNQLLDSIRQKMTHFIRQVDTQEGPATNSFNGFAIKH